MFSPLLEQFTSDVFAVSAACVSTAEALRHFLLRSREVHDIRKALHEGAITEETIREFVSSLMRGFHVGCHFEHELALTALAVALERRPTEFAEEFLLDLAKLRLAEMPLCIRVARACLRQRATMPQNNRKDFGALAATNGLTFREVKPVTRGAFDRIPTIWKCVDLRVADAKA